MNGIRDENALESAIAQPQNVYFYGGGDLFEIAAAYAFYIAESQAFFDGNKRTGIQAAADFLETDAVSILFKPVHLLYREAFGITAGNHLVISFMTLAELSLWPVRNNWGGERRALLANFIAIYTPLFPDETTCRHWAEISAESLDAGRSMGTVDTWIAACARQWGMALVTGNYKDFEHISGITLVPLGQ